MDIATFERVLRGLGIGPCTVEFGGLPNEAYVIEPHDAGWRIFYSERGDRSDERWFPTEAEAIDAMWEWLAEDHTIRMAPPRRAPFPLA